MCTLRQRAKSFLSGIMAEGLDPAHVFAAVFIGVFCGVVPIYGFQSLAAIGLATIFKLNKPLTFGATFINNPLLQPFLVFFSIGIGHYLLSGELLHLNSFRISEIDIRSQLSAWLAGSIILGVFLGTIAASLAAFLTRSPFSRQAHTRAAGREAARFVRDLFKASPPYARGFVRWKMRLDMIFSLLAGEDLREGLAVDLGCGYGIGLAVAAFRHPGRRLIGCDLDKQRISVAAAALSPLKAELSVRDVRTFEFPTPTLILILDVLQYLDSADQCALLKRCCETLEPGGRLIFRVPDRENQLLSKLTRALDGIIFRASSQQNRPVVLLAAEYEKILEEAGMNISRRRLVNRLPLAHVLFAAEKAAGEEENLTSRPIPSSTRAAR